ncbi:MAG TPA: rhodanese-like domain-containing protein, partial [Nakamurella sp.]
GIGRSLLGRLFIYDALDMSVRTIDLRSDPHGAPVTDLADYDAFCGTVGDAAARAVIGHTISPRELLAQRAAGADPLVVDVREPAEHAIVSIPGSVLIPQHRIASGEALASLPRDRQIVLHCKSGGRSAEALAVLHREGFADAVHLGGGVLEWVAQVDPSLPTY